MLKPCSLQQWQVHGKMEYMLSDAQVDLSLASTGCESMDGALAIADTEDIHFFLSSLLMRTEQWFNTYWVGAHYGNYRNVSSICRKFWGRLKARRAITVIK